MINKDYITEEERINILEWANNNKNKLLPNRRGPYRFFGRIQTLDYNQNVLDLIDRIKNKYNLSHCIEEKKIGHILSIIEPGGFVHPHKDEMNNNIKHFRYNLCIQKPEQGGHYIYNGFTHRPIEKTLLEYRPDLHLHSSTTVLGNINRINLSFGWQTTA